MFDDAKLYYTIRQLKSEGAFDLAFAALCLYLSMFAELLPADFMLPALLLIGTCGSGYALNAGVCMARARRFEKTLQRR